MAYSIGVEYGLHCLVYLIGIPSDSTIGIKELAEFQGISETYLSKIFGKLSKSGIIHSVPGVKGGYRLAKSPKDISFWDVIEAVEENKPVFQCKNIVSKGYLDRDSEKSECQSPNPHCIINLAMLDAEEKMRNELRAKTLDWLDKELDKTLSPKRREDTRAFFEKHS
ncbi:Rrf2 family transcriptional regulator [Paenibacillus agilis]|uniref:Rrf2 family transcriptional regulator n=1 Tax=Paenibacillus agilis TaxID=3020863 RepID=A0A559J0E8_9BACL|nr:Rrf2 family transcriptional regulator [Paenibacillus agilis]TVX93360.1 Rrf2 family transcriptional regulator [Paenibacillus agilis]